MNEESLGAAGMFEWLKAASVDVGVHFTKHDDDWRPMVFIEPPEGKGPLIIQDAGSFFNDERSKYLFVHSFLARAIESGARTIGLVLSSWARTIDKNSLPKETQDKISRGAIPRRYDEMGGAPSQDPNREERLIVTANDKDRSLMAWAVIYRHDNDPPRLGPWEDLSEGEGVTMSGLFGGDLQQLFHDHRRTDAEK